MLTVIIVSVILNELKNATLIGKMGNIYGVLVEEPPVKRRPYLCFSFSAFLCFQFILPLFLFVSYRVIGTRLKAGSAIPPPPRSLSIPPLEPIPPPIQKVSGGNLRGKYVLRPAVKIFYQLRPEVSASRVSVASRVVNPKHDELHPAISKELYQLHRKIWVYKMSNNWKVLTQCYCTLLYTQLYAHIQNC